MKTLLVALSHPDDEVLCAGTMAAHADLGWRVVLLFFTRGEMTESLGALSIEEIGRIRIAHAEEIGRIVGAGIRFLDFTDTRVEANADAAHRVAAEIADIRPDAVITWGDAWVRGLRHPDHQATGRIVRDAVTLARIAKVVAPRNPHRAAAPIFTIRDMHAALPEAAIDVTRQLDRIRAVASFYRERVGWPPVERIEQQLARNGERFGIAAAETFDAWETTPGLVPSLA